MGNDISSIINLGHQSIATSIATAPIKVIVERSVSAHDASQPLISVLSLNPTKQTWSELCHHLITYDYPSSCNTRLLNLLKDIYPTARLSTYKLRFHNGYCTIIKPKWSSNYDIDIPRIDAYVDVNVSFCDINNPKRFGPYDTIATSLLRGMDRNSTPEEQAARLRRPRVNLQITKLYGMENDELDVDCTPYPIYKELTKVLYVSERDEYQGYCEDIQVKDALIDGNVMGYKRLFPKICKEQQVKRVDVSNGNDVGMTEVDTERMDASDEKPKAQDMATTKNDESSSSSDSSDSSDSESEDEEETNQSMVKKNEPQKEEASLVNEKVAVNKDESSSSSSDSDSESEDEEEAKQSSTKENDESSSSSSDSSDSSDSEEEEDVNVKDKQASKEATRKENDKTFAKNQDESSSSSSSSSDSSDSEDESPIPTKKDSSSKTVSKAPSSKQVASTDRVSPQKKKVSPQKKTEVTQSKPNSKNPAEEKPVGKATEPKKPTSIQDTKVPAKSKNKRKREQNATKQALVESVNGDKLSPNNTSDQPKKKRKKANIMTGRYAKEIAAAKSAAAKPSTTNEKKKKSGTPKKKQDPNKPMRPKNGFYLYCDSVRDQLTAQNPDLPPKDIQVLMRKEYKSLSKSQLTAWKEVAKEAFERYEAYEKTLKDN